MSNNDVTQYKVTLFRAAATNKLPPLRPFLEENKLQWETVLDHEGRNLLHVAAMEGSEDVLTLMLSYPRVSYHVNALDACSRSALHLAAACGYENMAKRLLSAKATIDIQDEKGATPLLMAVNFEWVETVRFLLDSGADPLIENTSGANAVDIAARKTDPQLSAMLSGFAGRRRPASALQGIHRCIFPTWSYQERGQAPEPSPLNGNPTLEDGGRSPAVPAVRFGTPANQENQLNSAMAEACKQGTKKGDDGEVIEWDGLKPKLVNNKKPDASPGASSDGWWREAADAERQRVPDGKQASAAASAVAGALSSGAGAQVQQFDLQLYFDERAKKLEFEVEWQEEEPSVGNVKPSGEAEQRGLATGDVLVQIGGELTKGKGRDHLLPLLKQRPLVLKVVRSAKVKNPQDPYIQITLPMALSDFTENGVEVAAHGQLLSAAVVKPKSKAWAAGMALGDAIVKINGKDARGLSKSNMATALKDQVQTVAVWRRPRGSKPSPWTVPQK